MRERSPNELKILASINPIDYYNTQVVPLNPTRFRVISEGKTAGICPFHHDTDPSFHYWKKANIFHCFGCGVSGDVIRIHRLLRRHYFGEDMSVERAVEHLALLFNIRLDKTEGFKVKSPFEKAREVLLDRETYHIPKDVFNISQFRQFNNQINRMNLSLDHKIQNFAQLDLIASVALSDKD